jgi:hypothetical protein
MQHRTQAFIATGATALVLGTAALLSAARPPASPPAVETPLSIARIYWEYNSSANDLGVHVFLDAEDWKRMTIESPSEQLLFDVRGKGPYAVLGMTELFFEGAEPSLEEVELEDLLAMFPQGLYEFEGLTVSGEELESEASFSHAIPDGPDVFATFSQPNYLRIDWTKVTAPPAGFPKKPINVTSHQVIVGAYQVTVPASVTSVTVTPEFVASLPKGTHDFEVLAIEKSGNQSITEGTFVK